MTTLREVAVKLRNLIGAENQRIQLASFYDLQTNSITLCLWINGVRVVLKWIDPNWLTKGIDEIDDRWLKPILELYKKGPQSGELQDLFSIAKYGGQVETIEPILRM